MIYRSFLPQPALCEFVRNYTIIHFQFRNGPPPVKQRSPKPEQKIVFYIKGSVSLQGPGGESRTPPPVTIYSHQEVKRSLQVTPEFLALIVYFRPGVLHRLIKVPMSEFSSGYSDAELFFGTEVRYVSERLDAAAGNTASIIATVEKFLFEKCKRLLSQNPVDLVANHLLADPVSFSLAVLADQASLSTKQFYRKFVERVGMTPKLFSRLSRFNHAYQYKLTSPNTPWSSIAQEYGYTDYHHLEKEFKEFIGLTPKEWINTEMAAPERILRLR